MRIGAKLLGGGLGIVLAGSLAFAGIGVALADEAASQDAAPAYQEGWSDEAKELAANDTRMANTTGYEGGVDYWAEYENYIDTIEYADRDAANAEAVAPKRYVDYFGNIYQPTPNDPAGWNNTYLNADGRGCLSCHRSIEDILIEMDTRHDVYVEGYATTLTITNCTSCHGPSGLHGKIPLSTSLHGVHNGNIAFQSLGGNCESCHFVTPQGEFEMWDLVKYDHYMGLTDVSAEEAQLEVSYDQEVISDTEQQFFKSLWMEPTSWRTETDPAVADEWIVTIGGEVENPIEASVSELKEMFGTKTYTMKQQCIANGTGNAWIFQAEFTGIPIKDIIDYVKPADTVNKIKYNSEDGYSLKGITFDEVNQDECLLVTEINGEPLPVTQGWPLTLAIPRNSAASFVKALTEFNFVTDEAMAKQAAEKASEPQEETPGSPNAAVLNYPDGKVFQNGEPVHLEGVSDAFGDPISKIQFSLDGGQSWVEMETPGNDPIKWTYWYLDFTPPEPGCYLLKIRTFCQGESGTEYPPSLDTNFLFTVE